MQNDLSIPSEDITNQINIQFDRPRLIWPDTSRRLPCGSSKSEHDLKRKIKEFQTKWHKLMKSVCCLNNLLDQIAGFFPRKYLFKKLMRHLDFWLADKHLRKRKI